MCHTCPKILWNISCLIWSSNQVHVRVCVCVKMHVFWEPPILLTRTLLHTHIVIVVMLHRTNQWIGICFLNTIHSMSFIVVAVCGAVATVVTVHRIVSLPSSNATKQIRSTKATEMAAVVGLTMWPIWFHEAIHHLPPPPHAFHSFKINFPCFLLM